LPVDRKQAVDAGVIRHLPVAALKPYVRNARRHNDKQVEIIARSICEYGFVNPVLIDKNNAIVAGHGRYEAARRLGLKTVPTIRLEHLTEAQIRAYRIADNRIGELSE
jgi:ParB-like chromosome segregation protein Spo0J